MSRGHSPQLQKDGEDTLDRRLWLLTQQRTQRTTRHMLHHDDAVFPVRLRRQHLDDVRMIEPAEELAL
jgi:hypothetical protein